ncbi:SpoIIE family protein phosphatase [Leptospira yasudae]|uniref:SpoIIE family protein phosphatase n=1 Tax=Leptospira yasudae TaxID=2202201 RepID=UPI00142DAC31|nr:SpoIIE family protein phosphatase [Leptospira yasudae]
MVSFIYSFPRNRNHKESYIVTLILVLLGICGYLYYVLENISSPITYNFDSQLYEFQSPQSTAPMGILHFLTFLWILFVIVRKTIGEEKEFRNIEIGGLFFRLSSPNARMLRSFGAAIFIHTCFSIIYVLYATKRIPFSYFQIMLTSATSIQLFLYTVIYLNNSPQPSSFMVKIVGVTLVTTLSILGIVSRVMFQINETYFDKLKALEIETILREIEKPANTDLPKDLIYVFSHSSHSNLNGFSNFKLHYSTISSLNQTKTLFQSEAEEIGKYLNQPGRRILTEKEEWEEWEDYHGIEVSSARISKRMYRSLNSSAEEAILLIRYIVRNEDKIYEIGYSFSSYLETVHSIVLKMLSLILFTAVIIFLLFPYLFHAGLIHPLRMLLNGVKEVNEGHYDVSVPIRAEDEIGFLSRSFNHMVSSIRSAQEKLKEFAEILEEKVIERTNELRLSLDKVQELKTKQDADYYLTSLLIQPLSQNRSNSDNVLVEFLTEQKKKFQFKRWSSEIGGDLCVSSKITLKGKSYTVILNGDAMGKSMQGAGGALVLGSVFKAILERSRYLDVMNLFPEQWLKNAFIELHNIFKTFDATMLASGFISLLDDESGLLYYINAAHPLPVYYRSGTASFLPHRFYYRKLGMPINKEVDLFINTFPLQPEDVLIIGSDGRDDILIQDENDVIMNENEDFFLNCVEKGNGLLQNILDEIKLAGEIVDDVSLIRVEYKGSFENAPFEPEKTNEIYSEARREFRQKNYDNAISLLEKVVSENEFHIRNQQILKLLTNSYFQKKDFRKAAEMGLQYNNFYPDDLEGLLIVSESYKNLNNLKRAREFSERLRLRDPDHKQNSEQLHEIHQLLGDLDQLESSNE